MKANVSTLGVGTLAPPGLVAYNASIAGEGAELWRYHSSAGYPASTDGTGDDLQVCFFSRSVPSRTRFIAP